MDLTQLKNHSQFISHTFNLNYLWRIDTSWEIYPFRLRGKKRLIQLAFYGGAWHVDYTLVGSNSYYAKYQKQLLIEHWMEMD